LLLLFKGGTSKGREGKRRRRRREKKGRERLGKKRGRERRGGAISPPQYFGLEPPLFIRRQNDADTERERACSGHEVKVVQD